MNLAVHGLEGEIRQSQHATTRTPSTAVGQFDFVMANPPFNVNAVDKARLGGRHGASPSACRQPDNANYLWIQLFYSALNAKGRAGFVMANSAADARGSEQEIRRQAHRGSRRRRHGRGRLQLLLHRHVAVHALVPRPGQARSTDRADKVLFIDARHIYRQIDRAHRDWPPEQIEFLANIVRLYRGEKVETAHGSADLVSASFPTAQYLDVPGLCRVVAVEEIGSKHGWSLNPGRYVGVAAAENDGVDFRARLTELDEELEKLNVDAAVLQERIAANVAELLG